MSSRILAGIGLLTAGLFAADSTQQLPRVYFNDFDLVLDPAAYDAIAQSPFLKDEFSGFAESRPGAKTARELSATASLQYAGGKPI